MKLIELKCPACGAKLDVNPELKQFTCNYCGETTLLDDEVLKVEHVIVDNKKEEKIKDAEFYIKNNDTKKAYDILYKLSKEYIRDPKIYWEMIVAATDSFKDITSTYFLNSSNETIDIEELFEEYKKRETSKRELKKNQELYEDWNAKTKEHISKKIKERAERQNKEKQEKRKLYFKILAVGYGIILLVSTALVSEAGFDFLPTFLHLCFIYSIMVLIIYNKSKIFK